MRTIFNGILASLMAAGLVSLSGCEEESAPGGPGVASNGNGAAPVDGDSEVMPGDDYQAPGAVGEADTEDGRLVTNEEQTFELQVPRLTTDIARGEQDTVEITLDRGDQFDQEVTLTFEAPQGITLTPSQATIAAGQDSVEVTISASAEAPLGEQKIKVTGKPETGAATSIDLKVEVEEAENQNEATPTAPANEAAPANPELPPAVEEEPATE